MPAATTTQITVSIPSHNIAPLEERITRLNRRAARLGMEPVVMTVDRENPERRERRDERTGIKSVALYYPVTIVGSPIVESGWRFVATLHHEAPGATLVAALPGETIPVGYRWANNVCEHCGASRRRNATFLLRSERASLDGQLIQVGRNCLRDFLPSASRDPESLARWAELWGAFFVDIRGVEEDDWAGLGRVDPMWALDDFLSVTSLIMRKEGWTSRGKAKENASLEARGDKNVGSTVATADSVLHYMMPSSDEYTQQWLRDIGPVTEADKERAAKVIAWAEKALLTDDERLSDYEHNLSVVVRLGLVRLRHVGLAASMISAWQRATGAEQEARASTRAPSSHIASVGARVRLHNVQVLFTKEMEDRGWGASLLVKMLHDGKNVLTWFASRSTAWPEEGAIIHLKATVKAHSTYKGSDETALTRVVWCGTSAAEAEDHGDGDRYASTVGKGKVDWDDKEKGA